MHLDETNGIPSSRAAARRWEPSALIQLQLQQRAVKCRPPTRERPLPVGARSGWVRLAAREKESLQGITSARRRAACSTSRHHHHHHRRRRRRSPTPLPLRRALAHNDWRRARDRGTEDRPRGVAGFTAFPRESHGRRGGTSIGRAGPLPARSSTILAAKLQAAAYPRLRPLRPG